MAVLACPKRWQNRWRERPVFLVGLLLFFALPLFDLGAAVDASMQATK
ncbi:hypothetical protein [Haloarchaeobius amylolyticus]|nr:hypothetical protein [Haloarchaeobius amylolyticus]